MGKIQWNSELAMGVKEIDDQHKQLIKYANMLIEAVETGQSRMSLEWILKQLRDYTVHHFNTEEAYMKSINYPKLGEQMQDHARLKKDVKNFQRDIYEQRIPSPDEILAFMRGWLLEHILTHDRALARFIKEQNKPKKTSATIG